MKFIFLVLLSLQANAGNWARMDERTISFEGSIKSDEYERFKVVFDENVTHVVLDSGGGETLAALTIAQELFHQGVTVEVRHWCLSSCANYLFLAGREKKINLGIVGYHGNVKACSSGSKWDELERDLRDLGQTEAQIKAFWEFTQKQILIEETFLKNVSVSQTLFDRSCEKDKGMGDDKSYAFLLPLPETFLRYGIENVQGTQDLSVISAFPGDLAID